MRAVTELQRAAVRRGARGHVGDDAGNDFLLVGPHQEHVAALGRCFARVGRESAEV